MTIINSEFRRCNDCNEAFARSVVLSFNTLAPPPDSMHYEKSCPKCGSENTKNLMLDLEDAENA